MREVIIPIDGSALLEIVAVDGDNTVSRKRQRASVLRRDCEIEHFGKLRDDNVTRRRVVEDDAVGRPGRPVPAPVLRRLPSVVGSPSVPDDGLPGEALRDHVCAVLVIGISHLEVFAAVVLQNSVIGDRLPRGRRQSRGVSKFLGRFAGLRKGQCNGVSGRQAPYGHFGALGRQSIQILVFVDKRDIEFGSGRDGSDRNAKGIGEIQARCASQYLARPVFDDKAEVGKRARLPGIQNTRCLNIDGPAGLQRKASAHCKGHSPLNDGRGPGALIRKAQYRQVALKGKNGSIAPRQDQLRDDHSPRSRKEALSPGAIEEERAERPGAATPGPREISFKMREALIPVDRPPFLAQGPIDREVNTACEGNGAAIA